MAMRAKKSLEIKVCGNEYEKDMNDEKLKRIKNKYLSKNVQWYAKYISNLK